MKPETKPTVLYIEDNEASRKLLELLMSKRKEITFLCAEDGRKGINAAIEHLPDLILLDLTLPDMTGYEVLMELRATHETALIPIVVLSGDLPSQAPIEMTCTYDKYLPKPVELDSFYATLDHFLNKQP